MPLCFWTDLQGVTQVCEDPVPPSEWSAQGMNGHVFFQSPRTVGNVVRIPAGSETVPDGFRPLVGFDRTLQIEINGSSFFEAYGAFPDGYVGTVENVRIVRLSPSDGAVLETFPMAGTFPVTLVGQEANANDSTFRASFAGDLPPLDPAFAWGVLADLAMTTTASGGRPVQASFGGTYTFVVPTVFVVESDEYAFPLGPSENEEEPGFFYSAWMDVLPCSPPDARATIRVDGGPPLPLGFFHGCH
ncbi:hypothetical protein [Lysobacter sp. CA196]|uniref:hypothetical protein n=1 Tax=Lysobacter sp. CA196 TaxID=3455606 RepID=UPI003F8D5E1F